MRDLCRKLLLLGNHFFGWLKAEDSSTTCGTSTLKSLPSWAFFVSDVHLRPRKHFSRCTLDCGFKTSESPALRGFVAERCPITGTSLYLVLKSNGLHHSKNLPEKFSFSPKPVPTNIAKKLPPQRCSKPLFIAFFNFSYKWPMFAFTGESGYSLAFANRTAHNGPHVETGAFRTGRCHYPRSVPHVRKPPRVGYQNGVLCRFGILAERCSRRTQKACGTAMRLCASLFRGAAAPQGCVIRGEHL